MAIATPCQTNDAIYSIEAGQTSPYVVSCMVGLPFPLLLNEDSRKILEANIHNALELVLAPYFRGV